MTIKITSGSGRAHCQICNKIIKKGDCDMEYFTYMHNTHHHGKCVINEINKWKKETRTT